MMNDEDYRTGRYPGLLERHRDARFWHEWAMRALLALGGAHLLAGVVFFFAYNWDDLSAFAKFGVLQFAVVAAFAAALVLRLERPAGQAALIAASVFTGVLLAVIGQVYQTGADAWELFAAWTVLIVPWTVVSRSGAHWFFWILVCLAACSFYGGQRLVALGRVTPENLVAALGLLPLLFLSLRELALRAGMDWLGGGWFRRGLALLSLGALFFPALQFVFDTDRALPGFVAFVAASLLLGFAYATRLPDFSVVAMVVTLGTLMAMAIGGRVIFEVVDFDDNIGTLTFSLLLLSGWCVLVTSGAVRLLRHLHAGAHPEAGND